MFKQVRLLIRTAIIAIVLSSGLAHATPIGLNGLLQYDSGPTGDNGNHNGWYKGNGEPIQGIQYGNGQTGINGNNGIHNGWFQQNGETYQNTQYSSTQNAVSIPEPASLALLGAGLAGIGIWKRTNRKA